MNSGKGEMQEAGSVIIREMEREDLKQVCGLEKEIFSLPWSREGFLYSMNSPYEICLAAKVDETIAGYAVLMISFDEGTISNIAVGEAFRGQGIGEKLLRELIRRGNAKGAERFTLEVRVSNSKAISLYRKLGFESVGVRKGFYEKPREDALIMWK